MVKYTRREKIDLALLIVKNLFFAVAFFICGAVYGWVSAIGACH